MIPLQHDTKIPIFAYGILRKKRWLQTIIKMFGIEGVKITPAKIQGYVCYHSNGVNITFPVTDKQKSKNPKADWIVEGSLLYFYSDKPEKLQLLYEYINEIEWGYYREKIETIKGTECYIYLMSPHIRKLELIKIYSIGQVIYPDSIMDETYVTEEKQYHINEHQEIEMEADEKGAITVYENNQRKQLDYIG